MHAPYGVVVSLRWGLFARSTATKAISLAALLAAGALALLLGAAGARGQANVYLLGGPGTYGNPQSLLDSANARAAAVDAAGNIVMTGNQCLDAACSTTQGLTVAFGPAGGWKASLSSPVGMAMGAAVELDAAGNAYVLYELALTTAPSDFVDLAIAKYSSTGARQWIGYEYVRGTEIGGGLLPLLAVSPSGDAYIGYSATSQTSPYVSTALVIKYGTNGDRLWAKSPDPATGTYSLIEALGIDSAENVYAVAEGASSCGPSGCATTDAIFKYNASGELLNTYGRTSASYGNLFHVDPSGASYVTSASSSGQPTVEKFNADGTEAWTGALSLNGASLGAQLLTDASGEVFLGLTIPVPQANGFANLGVLKLNAQGKQEWVASHNSQTEGLSADEAQSIAVNSAGEAYITGFHNFQLPGNAGPFNPTTILTVKFDSAGKEMWSTELADPDDLGASPIGLFTAGSQLIVAGTARAQADTGFVATGSEWLVASYVQDAVQLSTKALNFGSVKVGSSSAPQTVTVTNTAETPLTFSVGVTGNSAFHIVNGCPASLAGFATCTLTVTFVPTGTGESSGGVTVTDNWAGNAIGLPNVAFAGTGTN